MQINEIFKSIQGECDGFGEQGKPTVFVRLQGCNLNCKWCDTLSARCFALNTKGWQECTIDEVMEEVLSFDLPKVTITGGEPLLQIEEVEKLTRILLAEDLRVTIETNGTIPWVLDAGSKGDNLRIVTDYKLPSSGMEKRMCEQTFEDLFEFDVIKFVVADDADYQRMKEVLIECLWEAQIAVSPLYAGAITHSGEPAITPHQLAEKILDDPDLKDVRFNVQLHKIIGVK